MDILSGDIRRDVVHEQQAVEDLGSTCSDDLMYIDNSPGNAYCKSNSAHVSTRGESEKETFHTSPFSPCTSSYGSSHETCDDGELNPTSVQVTAQDCLEADQKQSVPKPHSHPGIKEVRKKERNKVAAIRYRQKKKAKIEEILNEEKGLENRKKELKLKVKILSKQIECLQELVRLRFRDKGPWRA